MVCVSVEIKDRATTRRARITASSIEQALALAGEGKHDREVRLVFPIDPEHFFAGNDRALEGTPGAMLGEAA